MLLQRGMIACCISDLNRATNGAIQSMRGVVPWLPPPAALDQPETATRATPSRNTFVWRSSYSCER